jgi:hypothetical protein
MFKRYIAEIGVRAFVPIVTLLITVINMFLIIVAIGTVTENNSVSTQAIVPYKIRTAEFQDINVDELRDVRIKYPRIFHAESLDVAAVDRINSLILNAAKNDYENRWGTIGLGNAQEYCAVRMDANYLSILFTGMPYVRETLHPTSECFSVTIDLQKQEICSLASFVSDYDKISDRIISDGFLNVQNGEFMSFDRQQILTFMKTGQYGHGYMTVEPSVHIDDYFLSGERGLGIINRLSHASGDYSIIRIPDFFDQVQ